MGVQTGNYSDTPKLYYKPKNVNKERPCFQKSVKEGEEPETCNFIIANLFNIERSTYTHEGVEHQKINYYFTDDEGTEVVSLSGGWPTFYNKDWLNRLANFEGSIKKIKILLWDSEDKEKDKHYTRGSIQEEVSPNVFSKVKGKYPYDEIPKVKYEEYKGTKIKDDEENNKFFEGVLDQVMTKLQFHTVDEVKAYYQGIERQESKLNKEASKNFKNDNVPVGTDGEEFDDDVPF